MPRRASHSSNPQTISAALAMLGFEMMPTVLISGMLPAWSEVLVKTSMPGHFPQAIEDRLSGRVLAFYTKRRARSRFGSDPGCRRDCWSGRTRAEYPIASEPRFLLAGNVRSDQAGP